MTLSNLAFRPAQERDRTQFINLSRLAFSPLTSLADAEQEMSDRPINPEGRNGWVVEDVTGKLVARYRHLELALFLAGVRLPMAGIGGVAVAIEQRGQRLAQWMLEQALKDFREQEIPISMLYPFQHGFYRKLGWAWTGKTYQFRVSSRHLPLYGERSHVTAYETDQELALKTVYEKAAIQHNGWLQRSSWWWEPFFKPQGGREIYTYLEAGEMLGYVLVKFKHLGTTNKQLAVAVQEWVALTPNAYRGILGFLASLRDQVTTIVWNTYSDDPFPHLLKEQRHDPALTLPAFDFNFTDLFGTIGAGFMWRFVDIRRAFQLRPISACAPFALTFHLTDPVFGEEQFTIEFEQGRMHLTQRPTTTTLKTSVDHLMELFSGTRRSLDLLWTGELEFDGDRALLTQLDAAWTTASPFCWDAF